MSEEPIMTPCECVTCGHRWEEFFPDGLDDRAFGIECPKCRETLGRNINGRFLTKEEI